MRKLGILAGILALAGLIAVPVFAQYGPRGGGYGYGPCAYGNGYGYKSQLTPEQRDSLQKLGEQYYQDTSQARQQIWDKRDQLNALMRSNNPDEAQAKALQSQISELRNSLDQKQLAYQIEAQKIAPNVDFDRGYAYGRNRSARGGYGYGMRGGYGYGPGSCAY